MKILGSTFLVTGGASGLGRATIQALLKRGGRAVILDVNEIEAQKVISDSGADKVLWPGKTDITREESVQNAIHAALEKFGKIGGAVNCAGIAIAQKVISKKGLHSLELFERVQRVNVFGTFNVDRLVAAQLIKQEPDEGGERGILVNTASVAAFDGQNGQTAYSASKGAIVGLTLPLSRDLAPYGIRVMTIAPGVMDTPMLAGLPEKARQLLAKDVVFPERLGRPEEFGSLVCHIVENGYLNGETIRMDGGLRMPKM